MEQGDSAASAELLPLVYNELRRLASRELRDASGNSVQPTALVHEAYLRFVDQKNEPRWNHHGHFSLRRSERCGGFWSSTRAATRRSSVAGIENALRLTSSERKRRSESRTCRTRRHAHATGGRSSQVGSDLSSPSGSGPPAQAQWTVL